MDEAIVVFSRKGIFERRITARDVRSREDARKLWPLVSPDTLKMVTWVSPSFHESGKLRQRSHFRLLPPGRSYSVRAMFEAEEMERQQFVNESEEHSQAKKLIAAEFTRRVTAGLAMPWSFNDIDASDYHLAGDFLLGANSVTTEQKLPTTFGSSYRLDVAVLGPAVKNTPMVLGGVEIELGHAFDGRKALIAKSLSFVLVSIDITEMSLNDLTPQWAANVLSNTTKHHVQGRRQSYIYVHNLLYPLYAQLPRFINEDQRHQYLVFADTSTLTQLEGWIKSLAQRLEYAPKKIATSILNDSSPQSRYTLELAGQIVGSDWEQFNEHRFLRITVPRPTSCMDLQAHRMHLTLSRLLLCEVNALVGYQYCNGAENIRPEDDMWVVPRWNAEEKVHTYHRILPKRLAEPISKVLEVVTNLLEGNA